MIDLPSLFGPGGAPGQTVAFRLFPRKGQDRWLLEARFRRPWHLETWPQANRRARIIYSAAQLISGLGMHLPSRHVSVSIANGSLYAKLRSRFDAIAVFLGTPGPNRKVVVFGRDKDSAWFIKVPINRQTHALAVTEAETLAELATDESLAPLVPRCHWIGDALAIQDVRASGARFAPLDHNEIMRVHQLLFERSSATVPFSKVVADWTEQVISSTPHADPGIVARINKARDAAFRFVATIPECCPVDCYDAHGDFTRWNVLKARDHSARIIDWELFGRRTKFFDPFHYMVSHAILVERSPANIILYQAQQLLAGIVDSDDLSLYFGSYVAAQVFFYSRVFEAQEELHMQAGWQLDTWTDILETLVSNAISPLELEQDRK